MADPFPPHLAERTRIAHAATYLKGPAQEAWAREKRVTNTWDDYLQWLQDTVIDYANRMAYASLRLKDPKLGKNESVRVLARLPSNRPT
jgi:hypothetical protein